MDRKEIIFQIERLEKQIRKVNYRGYDPYDALNSSFLFGLAQKNQWIARGLIQGFRFFPFNIRPFLGIHPETDSKAIALIARAYWLLGDCTKQEEYWSFANNCLELLQKISIKGFSGVCWGHPFPFFSKRGFLPPNFPNVVCTVYAAHAFLDGYERLKKPCWLKFARSACDFVLKDLPHIKNHDTFCFSYCPDVSLAIHNANLLAVTLLVRMARLSAEKELLKSALKALNYTLQDQQPDGSWFYDGPNSPFRSNTFVDGFHTGFVLESLWNIYQNSEIDLQKPILHGLEFYLKHLFKETGQPYRFAGTLWPLDLRDCAQAIIVFSLLSSLLPEADRMCNHVMKWTIENMQSPKGFFYSLRWDKFVTPIFYIRFQGWILLAMSIFLSRRWGKLL